MSETLRPPTIQEIKDSVAKGKASKWNVGPDGEQLPEGYTMNYLGDVVWVGEGPEPEKEEVEETKVVSTPEPLQKIFDYISDPSRKWYTSSFEEFKERYSTVESQDQLFDFLKEKKAYTNSKGEFLDKYFPIIEEEEEEEDTITEEKIVEVSKKDDESSILEHSYMQVNESYEDFYKRITPTIGVQPPMIYAPNQNKYIVNEAVVGAPGASTSITTIDGITRNSNGLYINQNNEPATEEEIIRYNELEQLNNIRQEALKIISRSAGDYSDLSASEIVEAGKEEKKKDVDVTQVGDIDEALDYEFEDYLEYDQERLINNFETFLVKTNAPTIVRQEKQQQEIWNSKWEAFLKENESIINEDVKTIKQDVLSFWEPQFKQAKTQSELDGLISEAEKDLETTINLEVNHHYEDKFERLMLDDEELNAIGARHQEEWKIIQEKQWDQYVKNFKPKYDIFTPKVLDEIGEDLDKNYNFQYKNGPEKKMLLQRALDGYLREMSIPEGKNLEDVKNEYWSYFYKKLAFDPSSTNEDGTPTYSQWAYKDIATGALEEAKKELARLSKDYKPIKVRVSAREYKTITPEQQAKSNNPELGQIIDFSQRVLDNPEEMSKSGFTNFWKGLTSLQGHEYIPIVGGLVELNNSAHFYDLAKKKDRTKMEDLALSIYAIKNASDQKVSELGSTAYNGGKIGGGSVSFMGEVILTSGLYTGVRKGIQKAIKESLDKKVNKLVSSKIDDIMAKAAVTGRGKVPGLKTIEGQVKKQLNYKIKENAGKVVSFLAATAAQTSVNPQRYLKGMYDNMTPEIAFAYTDQVDDLITDLELNALVGSEDNPDLKDGDDPLKAFFKSYGTTWAEYGTERMGELLPGMAKGMAKKIGLTSPDFLKRMSIGLVMRKMGLSTVGEASDWLKRTAGYHGVFGELTEEFINMPLSNLINGETWHEGFDWQNTKEMTVGIGPTVFAMSGGNVLYNTMTGKSNPAYWVDYQRHETKEAALEHLNRLKKEGRLNKDTDIEIRNDFMAFDEVSTLLENEGLDNEIIKTSGPGISEGSIVAYESEMFDAIDDPNQRKEVEGRSDQINEKQNAIEALEEFIRTKRGATDKEKEDANIKIKKLQDEISDLKAANEVILSPIRDSIIKKKKTEAYQKGLNNLRNIYSKGNKGKNEDGSEILQEATSDEEVRRIITEDILRREGLEINSNGDIVFIDNGQKVNLDDASLRFIDKQVEAALTTHGGFTMDAETGKKLIVINKNKAIEGAGSNVAMHEFLHHFLVETLNKHPELKLAVGEALSKHIYNLDAKQIRDSDFRKRVMTYQQDFGYTTSMEETLNLLSDAIANGTYQYNESAMTKLGDIIRRIASSFGVRVEWGEGKDVFNFIRDYNKAFESGKLSKGFLETMEQGVVISGKIKTEAQALKDKLKEIRKIPGFEEIKLEDAADAQMLFSKDIENPLVGDETFQEKIQTLYTQGDLDAIQEAYKPRITRVLRAEWGWTEEIPDKFDAIIEEAVGPDRGVLQLILGPGKTKYDPTLGVPLSGHIGSVLKKRGLSEFVKREYPEGVIEQRMGKESVAKEVAKIQTKPQDVILTEKVLEKYVTPLLSDLKFTKDQIKVLRAEVLKIVGTKLKALDAAVSKNQSISPMIADMKKQLYVKNGPIHNVVYDIMTADMAGMISENLKTINPKTKKLYTRKQAEHKAFKDSVEKFFKTPKYKKAILDSLTTTWLAKWLPMGVQKKIVGMGWVNHDVWKGRKKGTKRGDVEAWQASEEGPYKGMTDGKQKIRRNPKAITDITPAMLLSAFVKGETPTEIKRKGLENISLSITQELGLEVFKADMVNDGKLKEVFKSRQDLFDRILNDNFVEEFVRQFERGTTKYSTDAAKEITLKTVKEADRRLKEQIGKGATYDTAVEIAGFKPIDLQTPEGRDDYTSFIIEKIIPMFSKRTLLAMSGSFTASASTLEKNWKMKFLFKDKESFSMWLDGVEQAGFRFGVNLSKQQEQDLYNAVKKEGYGKAKLKTQERKVKDKEFKDSKERGFRLFWEMIQKDIQSNEKTIPGYAFLMSSSSQFQGHFMRTGAKIDFLNTLTSKNREEHTSPITALGKYFFLHAVKGNLFTGGKNSIYDKAIKSYFQGSLPKFMDDRLKQKDENGKMIYNYSDLPPIELLSGILNGDISIWARYFHPNVNNNFDTDFDSMSEIDIANGEHLIGGINPNVMVLANGNTIAKEFGVDVKGKITPAIAAAQQNLIYRMAIGESISAAKIKEVLDGASKSPIKSEAKKQMTLANAMVVSRSIDAKPRGITVFDFDDTLATSKSNVISTAPDGTVRKLTAEQFAKEGADLLDQGYTHDFSEFNKVVKGKTASLFNKALKLQKKFGPENMFILTARPAESAESIHEFLKANGLNIPLKNITGLGNSTSEAKALWIAEKVGEGYNDFYFADDALQNVQAVKNMLDQFDVKSKIQQAKIKFSKDASDQFNEILEDVTNIDAGKRFSDTKARKRGASKGKFRIFIPPSHEDFVGLLYNFIGKGRKGDRHRDFFERNLIKPLNRAYREIDTAKQAIANDYKSLNKAFPKVNKKLRKKTPDGDFNYQDAIRVYLWAKHGYDIPGLSNTDQKRLVDLVTQDPALQNYAETLNVISKQDAYVSPGKGWEGGNIKIDLIDATGRVGRAQYLAEFNENADLLFSPENLNKIEAAYGKSFREALEDMLHRIKTGVNRPKGQNGQINRWMNFLNGSVGAVMFFNMRSAILQQMSIVNYINFADNNMFAAAKAFANQKQYWKDWAFIFNSDMLKQRRGGIGTDINGAELAEAVSKAKGGSIFDKTGVLVGKLLQLGFTPTQIGDNIAIATGGATFYRNRINKYLKEGFSQKEAEAKAFTDFQDITQSTQQSSRPDMTSQQQSMWIGKMVLNFQNITSQYNRLIKKAALDIYNRRISPPYASQAQSDIGNMSRILYYGAIQNVIFYSLQTALFAVMFGDEDESNEKFLKKKERVINGTIDSILRGSGIYGVAISTLKNMAIKWHEQRDKKYNKDESAVLMELLNFSPVLGIKARKIVNAEKTINYNESIISEMETFDSDNPQWSAATNYVEALTNFPANRLYQKSINVRNALDNDYEAWQRALFFSGYTTWSLGLGDTQKMIEVKEGIKEKKKEDKKKKAKVRKEEKKKEIAKENEAKIKENKKKSKEDGRCAAISKSGNRCKREAVKDGFCTVHEKAEQREDGKKRQCKKRKADGSRCKMQTSNKSGYCYYHD